MALLLIFSVRLHSETSKKNKEGKQKKNNFLIKTEQSRKKEIQTKIMALLPGSLANTAIALLLWPMYTSVTSTLLNFSK